MRGDLLFDGPEGGRTPVRKPIPRYSTIIVHGELFALWICHRHQFQKAELHDTSIRSKLCACRFLSGRRLCPGLTGTSGETNSA